MKIISIILLLTVTFLGLNQLASHQQTRQANRPVQVTIDLTALAR